jgi:hypothetical protein
MTQAENAKYVEVKIRERLDVLSVNVHAKRRGKMDKGNGKKGNKVM